MLCNERASLYYMIHIQRLTYNGGREKERERLWIHTAVQ